MPAFKANTVMPISFHDLNDFFNLLSMSLANSVGCVVVVNALRIMQDVCMLHRGHPHASWPILCGATPETCSLYSETVTEEPIQVIMDWLEPVRRALY